jgi:hypothetical protein
MPLLEWMGEVRREVARRLLARGDPPVLRVGEPAEARYKKCGPQELSFCGPREHFPGELYRTPAPGVGDKLVMHPPPSVRSPPAIHHDGCGEGVQEWRLRMLYRPGRRGR